jgi:hypothetical protein
MQAAASAARAYPRAPCRVVTVRRGYLQFRRDPDHFRFHVYGQPSGRSRPHTGRHVLSPHTHIAPCTSGPSSALAHPAHTLAVQCAGSRLRCACIGMPGAGGSRAALVVAAGLCVLSLRQGRSWHAAWSCVWEYCVWLERLRERREGSQGYSAECGVRV